MRPDCCEGLDALGAQRIDNGLPAGQNLADGIWAVADEQHVAAGSVSGCDAGDHVADYADGKDSQGHKTLVVKMKYVYGAPVIPGIDRVSTPGRRLYYRYTEIPRVLNGLGISILSTSKGLMKDQDCRRNKAGGELVCNVW